MENDVTDALPRPRLSGRSNDALSRILLVDDEPAVLSALQRQLRGHFDVVTANGGVEAIGNHLDTSAPYAAVMTDMRMPGSDGVAVLKAFREKSPDTVRLLLTGYADLDAAIAAVNDGNVFRFLTKPSSPDVVRHALQDAVKQYLLVQAERELLEGTLHGSVRALLETLSLANPAVFARAARLRGLVSEMLDQVDVADRWEIEVATMLSQVGAVTLPPRVTEKLHTGARLEDDEQQLVDRLPAIAVRLLADIPRIDGVKEIISAQGHWMADDAPLGTKLIRLASDFDALETREIEADVAIRKLSERERDYGQAALAALKGLHRTDSPQRVLREIPVADIAAGMVLASDVRTKDGMLLVAKGFTVTESVLDRINNFAQSTTLEAQTVTIVQQG